MPHEDLLNTVDTTGFMPVVIQFLPTQRDMNNIARLRRAPEGLVKQFRLQQYKAGGILISLDRRTREKFQSS